MMKLKRLDISGFKSFVDPVSIDFAGGITAIVGPNGCGKSNLADAVTWVLGEQSAKSLRGGRMEDVIFAGSQRRKPLGVGEVALELQVDPSFEEAEDGKILLGRRVMRTGESRYQLNGRTVRLKEIKDLLMDTGLGIRAYSVIEQGKIGMILSGKPQERRKLLEEAAGITRYKARRRVAEIKLEESRANLLRLDDIVAEVERALRSLKRQASAARRYREREAEYQELLRATLLGRWSRLAAELAALATSLAAAEETEAGHTAELARSEAALTADRETLEGLAHEVAERHQRVADAAATIEGRQQFLTANRQRLTETGERAEQSRRQAERRAAEIQASSEALGGHRERRGEMLQELESARREVSQDDEALTAAGERLRESEGKLEAQRQKLLSSVDRINRLKAQLQETQIELERGNFQRRRLGEELAENQAELAQADEALTASRERVDGLAERIEAAGRKREELEARLDATMAEEAETSQARRSAETALAAAQSQRKLLAELSRAHRERRSRLEETLARHADGTDAQPAFLADRASALAGWERALDFYLAELADAVIATSPDAALELTRALTGDAAGPGPGGAVLIPATAGESPEVDDPAVILSVGQALGLPAELSTALPPGWLVEEPADAARLARLHPGVAFVSRGGVWAEAGVLRVEGDQAAPGVLERAKELDELGRRIPQQESELAAIETRLEELVAQRSELARVANKMESELGQARQEMAVAEARREDAEARRRRLGDALDQLSGRRTEVDGVLARTEEVRGEVARDLEHAEQGYAADQTLLDRLQRETDSTKADHQALREASAGRRGRLELLSERLAAHDREIDRITLEISDSEQQVELWRSEAQRLDRSGEELTEQLAQAENQLQRALEARAVGQDAVLEAQQRLDTRRQALRRTEERIQAVREARDAARSQANDLRVQRAGREQDAEHLTAAFSDAFDDALPEAPEPPPANLAELEADLERTKATLERLGPVNVLAVEEYAEQEERHEFLTRQRTDVIDSIDSLRKTIREINSASSERFASTFAQVNSAFGEVFQHLFRGGEAEMRLLDEDDPLETGIEIVARPPGKRLQNIMLLSGGEKALTAIALLFALFRTKPSPFCILDEVDAPLDDVNTLRFVELVRAMAGETQFIVITHNKLTMEAASTLYGVTMEEKGVSKLVAVEIDTVQPEEAEAQTA